MTDLKAEWTKDRSFDRYARLVRNTLGVPTSTVSLIDDGLQWTPGASGVAEPYQSTRTTPLEFSLCRFVVAGDRPLVFNDTREVPLVKQSKAVTEMGLIAYAGIPLRDVNGQTIGALCAASTEPREWSEQDLANLSDLADACSADIAGRQLADEKANGWPGATVGADDLSG
ncbi:hypothetical protein BH09ACT11_BH09ACT11_05530 [soil metagenome]